MFSSDSLVFLWQRQRFIVFIVNILSIIFSFIKIDKIDFFYKCNFF